MDFRTSYCLVANQKGYFLKNSSQPIKLIRLTLISKGYAAGSERVKKEVMLAFPNFAKKFTPQTDASALQLGAVIMQSDKPIAFYSQKLTETQKQCGVGEIESEIGQ